MIFIVRLLIIPSFLLLLFASFTIDAYNAIKLAFHLQLFIVLVTLLVTSFACAF
jgi:hypothetical protein